MRNQTEALYGNTPGGDATAELTVIHLDPVDDFRLRSGFVEVTPLVFKTPLGVRVDFSSEPPTNQSSTVELLHPKITQ